MIREKNITGQEQTILIDYLGSDDFYKLSFSKIENILKNKLITFLNVSEIIDYYFEILKTHRGFKRLNKTQMLEKIYNLKNKQLDNLIKLLESNGVTIIKGINEEPLFFGYYEEIKNKKRSIK